MNLSSLYIYMGGSRGGQAVRTPTRLKNHKNIGFPSIIDPEPLKSQRNQASMEMFLALLPMVYIFLSLFVLLECALMLMEMFLALLPMVYIFLSLFVLLECALMLMTSTTETYF